MTIERVSVYRLVIGCCVVVLASCAAAPKTVSEFRTAVTQGASFMTHETYIINREFPVVVKNVGDKSKECLGFGYTTRTTVGTSSRQTNVTYHPTVKLISNGKAEMFLQEKRTPQPIGSPEGGAYIFLADINRVSETNTRITMYGPTFPTWTPIFSAIKGWAEGKSVKCPDSP
jgi:hypothetical protein